MRAIVITAPGPDVPANLRLVHDAPEPPPPPPGHAQVRTLASALNHLDLWVGRGVPGLSLTYPRVSGSDACGQVVGVGEGVDPAWIGRRVILDAAIVVPEPRRPDDGPAPGVPAYELIGEHHDGTHREHFNAPIANLQPVGPDAPPTDAAAFGLVHLTAYSMMIGKGDLRAGQWVLITGIGGGVAGAALGIARWRGARTIVTSRSASKLDAARALGADHTLLDSGEDWSKEVRRITGGRGVDMAVDSTGKATHLRCVKALARGGVYVTPGCTSGPDATTDLARIFWHQLRIIGSTMGTPDEFAQVAALYRAGALRPVVDRVYAPGEARAAWSRLAAGEQMGKIVLDWTR
jgi:NADPH:quinone reductase-like Zn-dependent oxidoreductase